MGNELPILPNFKEPLKMQIMHNETSIVNRSLTVVARYKLSQSVLILTCALMFLGCGGGMELNDVHSQLNRTWVERVHYPRVTEEVVRIVKRAKASGKSISISGSRHAMGGQQFGEGTIHISMSKMNDVLGLDRELGVVRIEAGIEWPKLVQSLLEMQKDDDAVWSIIQKQTGADQMSIGGALSANAHGRGVRFKPIVQDVESFTLVNAEGEVLNVSRREHPELFGLVIGGYGLFGVITTVDLRLARREKLERVVEVVTLDELPDRVIRRLEAGFVYGDYQYKTDGEAKDFMRVGVFSAYKPVPASTLIAQGQKRLNRERWYKLLELAHTDKSRAFELYSQYYLTTNGQIYWSDLHQMSEYLEDYVTYLKEVRPELPEGSLMITEIYVPRKRTTTLVNQIIEANRRDPFNIVYGTMRLIERDDETFLAWAKEDYACIIFNLRVEWTSEGIEKAKVDFRRLIDCALELDGSYFLTYHRWARKEQVLRAYPQFIEFLKLKLKYDSEERFQSEWYRHYKRMFARELSGSD